MSSEHLLDRYLEQTLTAEEAAEFQTQLATDAEFRKAFLAYVTDTALIIKVGSRLELSERAAARLHGNVAPIHPNARWKFVRVSLALAASLAIAVGVWWFSQRQAAGLGLRVAEVQRSEVRGQRSEVRVSGTLSRNAGLTSRVQGSGGRDVPAVVGMELREGDRMVMASGATATLKYDGEDTWIDLRSAVATFRKERGAKRVTVASGMLMCMAAPQEKALRIETTHAVAEVIGTRFQLDVASDRTTLKVLEGKVALCQGEKRLEVGAGRYATATGMEMSLAPAGRGSRVYAWGYNAYGQLGDGTTNNSPTPAPVPGLDGVLAIAAGKDYTLAIARDRTVWAWGLNAYNQVGDGTRKNRLSPVQVRTSDGAPLSGVISVAAGHESSVAIRDDGSIWNFGRDVFGEPDAESCPVRVQGIPHAIAAACGGRHVMALTDDGRLWAFGKNNHGQLGVAVGASATTPVTVSGISNVIAVACGFDHTLALRKDRTLWAWGQNNNGQLGVGTTKDSRIPVQVTELTDVIAIACGRYHSMALRRDRTVWMWGAIRSSGNDKGELCLTPVPVPGLSGVVALGDGGASVIKSDGTAWHIKWLPRPDDGTGVGGFSLQQAKLPDAASMAHVTAISVEWSHNVAVVSEP